MRGEDPRGESLRRNGPRGGDEFRGRPEIRRPEGEFRGGRRPMMEEREREIRRPLEAPRGRPEDERRRGPREERGQRPPADRGTVQ